MFVPIPEMILVRPMGMNLFLQLELSSQMIFILGEKLSIYCNQQIRDMLLEKSTVNPAAVAPAPRLAFARALYRVLNVTDGSAVRDIDHIPLVVARMKLIKRMPTNPVVSAVPVTVRA